MQYQYKPFQWSQTAITNTDNLERMYLPVTYPTSFLCVMVSDWCAERDIGFFQHSVITNSYTTSTFRIKTFSVLYEEVIQMLNIGHI